MSDGAAARQTTEAQADAAASEAARDARAEAYEAAEKSAPVKSATKLKKSAAASKEVKNAKKTWHNFTVDVWLTPLNSIEFGIYKHSRNKAKSRQFTTDMDVFAEVIEDGERTGVLAYRKELWKDQTGTDKRLVFKLFSETLNWRGSMDMMVGRSLQQTLGARGLPVVTYSINTSDDDFVVMMERSANKWPFMPENFSFFLMHDDGPRFYRFRRDFINLGGDYSLRDQTGDTIGYIDGAIFTIGGRWKCSLRSDHKDARLLMVMKMFTGMISFNGGARRHVKQLARDVKAGRLQPAIQRQESDLYMNPRRVR